MIVSENDLTIRDLYWPYNILINLYALKIGEMITHYIKDYPSPRYVAISRGNNSTFAVKLVKV